MVSLSQQVSVRATSWFLCPGGGVEGEVMLWRCLSVMYGPGHAGTWWGVLLQFEEVSDLSVYVSLSW